MDRQVATLTEKAERLQAMIQAAEGRRAHLRAHLAELRAAGRRTSPAPRTRETGAVTSRSVGNVNALRALRHRNYRLFFGGQAVSLAGSWMQSVAQAWLVLTLTDDPLMLGVVAAAQWTPVLVLGLFGGLIADALPKRQTLVIVEAVMATLAIVLGVLTLTGVVEVWMILVLARAPRLRERGRDAGPPGVLRRDGRTRGRRERHRPQLGDVQCRASDRAGRGRPHDRRSSTSRSPSSSTAQASSR